MVISRQYGRRKLYYRVFFLIVVIFLAAFTLLLTRSRLLDSYLNMGLEIVSAYSARVEYSIKSYSIVLDFASETLTQLMANHTDKTEITRWITRLDNYIKVNLESNSAVTYIVFSDGVLCTSLNHHNFTNCHINITSNEIADSDYNKISVTPIYMDEADNNIEKITVFKKIRINNEDAIIATEFSITELQLKWNGKGFIPDIYTFFLKDDKGRIVFSAYNMDDSSAYLSTLNMIKKDISFSDEQKGVIRGRIINNTSYNIFFVYNPKNNYTSILTMPNEYMSFTYLKNIRVYIYIISALILITIIFLMKDKKQDMQVGLSNDFINIIGDSYYAIISINIKKNKYEVVKGSSDILKYMPDKGEYTKLHQLICTVVEKGMQDDFAATFSIENIHRLIKQGRVDFGGDFQRIVENGYIWVKIRLIYNKEITEDYAVLCFKNRDDERKIELQQIEMLESSIAAMKKSNKTKSIFYSGLSHDMRTPLNAILGLADLIQEDSSNTERVLDYVDKMKISGRQLLDLVDNFLDYTKETYDKDSDNIEFSLKEYVETNLYIYYMIAEKDNKKFSIKWDITHNYLIGDTSKLYRILHNLIMNSFKYTKHGDSIKVEIIELHNEGKPKYKFIFKDSGIGMSKDFISKIFNPYQKEKRFDIKESTGVGLGMSIVENYVRILNGKITVESEINKGTTITVILAFDTAEENVKIINKSKEYAGNIEGLSILVAEDNNINMFIVTELLTRNGCNVFQAWNGKEAVDVFKNSSINHFDIILMDIQMPEINGLDAATIIRSLNREDAKIIPIIAVSANVYTEDVAASSAAGMNAHLAKPINYSVLQSTIYKLIKNKNKKN